MNETDMGEIMLNIEFKPWAKYLIAPILALGLENTVLLDWAMKLSVRIYE